MLELFLYFGLLSLLAVGGISSIMPEMQRIVVEQQQWVSAAEFTQLFAVSQAAPGPNVLICSLIGWKLAGLDLGRRGKPLLYASGQYARLIPLAHGAPLPEGFDHWVDV